MACDPRFKGSGELIVGLRFTCDQCAQPRFIKYQSNYGDNLNYRCECGNYYKKAIRIAADQIISESYERVCSCCQCADSGEAPCCFCGRTSSEHEQHIEHLLSD